MLKVTYEYICDCCRKPAASPITYNLIRDPSGSYIVPVPKGVCGVLGQSVIRDLCNNCHDIATSALLDSLEKANPNGVSAGEKQ